MTTNTPAQGPDSTTPSLRGHVAVLDGVRGLAILLVIQFHAYSLFSLAFSLDAKPKLGLFDTYVGRLSGVGWAGVDLFFVLSGFLITGILYDAKASGGFFRNFYARRFLRIFPLYYGFLLFILLVMPHIGALKEQAQIGALRDHQVWYWTYTLNIWVAVKHFHANLPIVQSHFWSLAVEEQFYLIWPAVVLTLGRRDLMRLCVVLSVGALLLRLALTSNHASAWFQINAAFGLMPARFDTFALGALVALAARGAPDELARLARIAPFAGGAALAVLISLFVTRNGLSSLDLQVQTWGLSALAVGFTSLLVLVVTARERSLLRLTFANPALTFVGRYAYGLYVFHLLVAMELLARLPQHGFGFRVAGTETPARALFALIVIGVTMVVAWLSWHLYEKQFLKLKRYFPYGREPRGSAAPASDAPAASAAS